MHDSPKLTSFIALRANGWSLASISLEISVPKSTLWEWDTKHQEQILRLKQLQLEKFQQRFLPTYEEELAKLCLHLNRIEAALQEADFEYMNPGYLLQLALQLRSRLAGLTAQSTLRHAGCITRNHDGQFTADDISDALRSDSGFQTSPVDPAPATDNPESVSQNRTKPDEIPPSPQNRSLIDNHLQHHTGRPRPVLPPQEDTHGQCKKLPLKIPPTE